MNPFESYRLTSPFGYRIHPVHKTKKFHRGVDLVVSPSTGPIYAFVAGEVLHAKMGATGSGFGGYGITVAIKDDKGFLHVYAHLSSAAVSVGQRVKRGQEVGKQGSTGVSTGPHLHYEVRKVCTPQYGYTATESGVVEPTEYLRNYYANETKGEAEVKKDVKATVNVGGKKVGEGYVEGGVTYVPVRVIAEALGAKVSWDAKTKTVTITKEGV
ncbi:peptidoglycan DD-metalloendopeptidase family protein [Paenibacillus tundrae]|uniref:Murein DD-endopeptidase MepM/ murein hydrolase activator NlpD n=1 Tax=Paenibacillus tundrae TaxID=528187 RepID=A0ABT9W6C7_9BACL|nr:peptidoglycan DD-metalloendopeptidase family protein [Paenibacillus tundrae]MDQ0168790.1 murein DD-endopeptidase MepM/ murein hydrolase activator NlpD [Paenibacillus tundrae]